MIASRSPRRRPRSRLALVALSGGLIFAACGGDDDAGEPASTGPSGTSDTSGPSTSGAAMAFNDADVTFAQQMIAHHQEAIEMAAMAEDPAREASAAVTDLAARIKAAQGPEIATMTAWLTSWGEPLEMESEMAGHDMSMPGAMSDEDMAALAEATGDNFDEMWLTMMVEHHEGAIEMASAIQSEGVNPEVRAMAGTIVTAQEAEVTEMRALLDA